jgi:hypothetical protein
MIGGDVRRKRCLLAAFYSAQLKQAPQFSPREPHQNQSELSEANSGRLQLHFEWLRLSHSSMSGFR